MMELRWKDANTKAIGIAFVTDNDAEVLQAMGYYHCNEEDFTDDELDKAYVEIWKPVEIMENIWICVYRDTIEEHDDDWNLTEVQVTKEFAEQYFNECILTLEWNVYKTFEEFYEDYNADDTQDFYDYAMKHDAVIAIENW